MGHIIKPGEGEILGAPAGVRDRFLIDSEHTDGRLSVVEHLLAPHSIAAPLHLHTREDEYTFVLEGRIGAVFGGEEVIAEEGDLLFKPRGEWHTFWNPDDTPARVLEMISPGGLERLFRAIGRGLSDEEFEQFVGAHGCEADLERTMPIIKRHGLTFG